MQFLKTDQHGELIWISGGKLTNEWRNSQSQLCKGSYSGIVRQIKDNPATAGEIAAKDEGFRPERRMLGSEQTKLFDRAFDKPLCGIFLAESLPDNRGLLFPVGQPGARSVNYRRSDC